MNYIDNKKIEIIQNCLKCKGLDSRCNCHEQFAFELKKIQSNIPPKFCSFTIKEFENYLTGENLLDISDFIEGNTLGLYLEFGSKLKRTSLICAILINQLKTKKVLFYNSSDLIQIVTNSWFGEQKEEYKKILNCDVLGISDIGDERRNDTNIVEDIFDNIIRDRLFNMKQLIISSSLTIEQFTQIYTKERADLVMSSFKIISFPQEDLKNIFKEIRNDSR